MRRLWGPQLGIVLLCASGCATLRGLLENSQPELADAAPVATSLAEAWPELPFLDGWAPASPRPLGRRARAADGGFRVARGGAWSLAAQSFCVHAGSYGPGSRGDGYLYAPLGGVAADPIREILRNAV